jgi:hypothetical protein
VSNRGSLTISNPLAIKLKGFFVFFNNFLEKEGFSILRVEYNIKVSSIYYFPFKRVKRGERKNLSFR